MPDPSGGSLITLIFINKHLLENLPHARHLNSVLEKQINWGIQVVTWEFVGLSKTGWDWTDLIFDFPPELVICNMFSNLEHTSASPGESTLGPRPQEGDDGGAQKAHLQLGIQVCIGGHDVFVFLLPCGLNKGLLCLPILLLHLIYDWLILSISIL